MLEVWYSQVEEDYEMINVADIMTPDPIHTGRNATLGEIISLMKANFCRQILVIEDEQLLGIVTDRDVRVAVNSPFVLHERSQDQSLLNSVTAEAVMTREPMTIEADAPASLAAKLLKSYKFGSLPVMRGGKVVGIVTVSDILGSYIGLLAALGQQQ